MSSRCSPGMGSGGDPFAFHGEIFVKESFHHFDTHSIGRTFFVVVGVGKEGGEESSAGLEEPNDGLHVVVSPPRIDRAKTIAAAIEFVPIGLRLIHGCGSLALCGMSFVFSNRARS